VLKIIRILKIFIENIKRKAQNYCSSNRDTSDVVIHTALPGSAVVVSYSHGIYVPFVVGRVLAS
jgi:hypothetical protein